MEILFLLLTGVMSGIIGGLLGLGGGILLMPVLRFALNIPAMKSAGISIFGVFFKHRPYCKNITI